MEDRQEVLQGLDQVARLVRCLVSEQVQPADSASGAADSALQRVEERHETVQRLVTQLQTAIGVPVTSKKVELRQASYRVALPRRSQ